MRRTVLTPILVAVTVLLVSATTAISQESTMRGLVLGVHLGGSALQIEGGDRSNGGGGGVIAGYGVNRNITVFLQMDGASINVEGEDVDGTWAIGHGDLGVRFNFANSLRGWVPYAQASLGGRAVSVSDVLTTNPLVGSLTFSGGAFTLGGGIMLYVREAMAFDIGVLFSGGEFTDVQVGNATVTGLDIDASTSRFNVGLVWWL